MRILLLGGTRFLGRHLVEAARARGHEVTLFNRGSDRETFPEVERLVGDRGGRLEALRGRSWDVCVDTSGYHPDEVRASARLLARRVEHYTFVSSISVYGEYPEHGLDETAPVLGEGDDYGARKAQGERAAAEAMPGRVLVVRAGLIVGPHDYTDRFTYWVRRVAEGGDVLAPGRPERPVQLIDARDLAAWIVRMAEERQADVLNATGRPTPMGRLLEELREALGGDARFAWVPDDALLAAGVEEWEELPLWIADSSTAFRGFLTIDVSRALAAGLSLRPLADTARDTLDWDRARGGELAGKLRRPREADLLRERR